MKRTLLALMLTFVGISAFAQRQGGDMTPEQRAENQTKTLKENLSLTDDQQKQVYDLSLARAKKMQELRDAQTNDRSQMRAAMEEFNTEIAKILTPEQQTKYQTMLDDRRGGPGGERRGPRGN